jgi:hypothetical protein
MIAHVLTFLYYNQSFGSTAVNARLGAQFMAAHADFVESSGFDNRYVNAFKAAGGRFAVTYIDPTYVPYCVPPFVAPAGRCAGQVGDLGPGERAWFHDSSGARVHRSDSYTGQFQEFLNPAAAQAREAVATWMNRYLAKSPDLDLFFSDDSGSTFGGPDGTPRSGMFYGFNAVGTEITSDAAWIAGENALFSGAPRKLIINGGYRSKPAYDGVFLRNPNVAGANHEGCFNSAAYGGRVSDAKGAWADQADGLLADLPFRKYSLCMMNGPSTAGNRLYALASWWLTYDPKYSVAAPIAPASDGNAVFAEYAIVPNAPKESASGGSVRALYRGGVYVREFDRCFQDGRSIGGCAAIVNPGIVQRSIPALSRRYTRTLTLSDTSIVSGGQAVWDVFHTGAETKTPAGMGSSTASLGTLGPMQAVVLKQ